MYGFCKSAWCAEHLFERGFAQMVVEGDASTGNAILQALDAVRRVVGIKNSPSAGDIASLERLFMQALENRGGAREGDVRHSISDDSESISIKEQLRQKQDVLSEMNPVASINTPDQFANMNKNQVLEWVLNQFSSVGYQVDRQGFGVIVFDKNRINRGLGYLNTPGEYAALATIPKVLKRGVEIGAHDNHKGREYGTITIAAPVEINGKRGNVAVVVSKTKGNYYKTHRILMPDGSQFVFEQNQKQSLLRQGALSEMNTHALPIGSVSNTKVPQNDLGVNTHSMQNGKDYSKGAFLSPERMTGDALIDPIGERDGETIPPSADADTSLYTREADVDETEVLETAIRSQMQGRAESQVRLRNKDDDVGAALDELARDLGEEELLRRMYNAAQINRPTGTVEIDGQQVDANVYTDAYEQALPEDPAALQQIIKRLERERTDEIARKAKEGTLEDYSFGGLKIDLQLFAARRKWDLLQLEAGEEGTETRQFYEKRLRGTDANHHQELVDLLAGRDETYNPIANEKTLSRAKDKLRGEKYQQRLMKRLMRYDPHDLFNTVDVAAAQVLINDALNDGEWQAAMDLITGLSRKGTELGRAVQAFSMMARLTPEGTLRAAQRTIKSEADYVIGEGASDGLDMLADDIADALGRLARLKGSGGGAGEAELGSGAAESDRYDRLKNRSIKATQDKSGTMPNLSLEELEHRAKSKAKNAIVALAKEIGILNRDMSTPEVDFAFRYYMEKGLLTSLHHQQQYGGNYADFAKMLANIDTLLNNAVMVEQHADKYTDEDLEKVYVLFSVLEDENGLYPIQFEVKKYKTKPNKLYLTAVMIKEEAGVVGGAQSGMNRSELPLLPASEYSLADLFANINPQDAEFLKYVPDGFLNDQQINAKRIAQSKERARIEGYEKKGPSREELTNALAEDLAAEKRNYLSKKQIKASLLLTPIDNQKIRAPLTQYPRFLVTHRRFELRTL